MKPFEDLINKGTPAIELLNEWASNAELKVEILPASEESRTVFYKLQSPDSTLLGALAYNTGGIIVDKRLAENTWFRP